MKPKINKINRTLSLIIGKGKDQRKNLFETTTNREIRKKFFLERVGLIVFLVVSTSF